MICRLPHLVLPALLLCSCVSTPPKIPQRIAADPAALGHAASMRETVVRVAEGWGNLGRLGAVQARAEEMDLQRFARTEWIDWFTPQKNFILDLPGSSPRVIYVVAHYDKTDINPLHLVSLLVNGALDDIVPIPSLSQGALDNGTGIAVALEVAAGLAETERRYSYRFLFPGGEEPGLRGTRSHLARLSLQEKELIRMAVNIDTVGVSFAGNCFSAGEADSPLAGKVAAAARRSGAAIFPAMAESGTDSDYAPFLHNGFLNDFLMGLQFNYLGGLLPQRSWFSRGVPVPVVGFSACGLTGSASQNLLLPYIHGPRDNIGNVDIARLYEQYLLTAELLAAEEREAPVAPADAPSLPPSPPRGNEQ